MTAPIDDPSPGGTIALPSAAKAPTSPNGDARFVSGSLLRHILVMTGAGAIGLIAIFIGDFANILFLSWLADQEIVAAVGYASSILFFTTSIGIGLSIAATSVVSPAIGAGDMRRARRLAGSALVLTAAVSLGLTLLVWLSISSLLSVLGAAERTHALAAGYLQILVPFLPPLAVAMTATALLRSIGDARRAMNVTLVGAITNVALDPILIFALALGIDGAAIASAIARLAMLAYGLWAVIGIHDMTDRPTVADTIADAPALAGVAVPAVLTNIATPVANAYVTAAMAAHGDAAVAAWAVIGRITPVAFGAIYALSGAIGPIVGQNFGARDTSRMQRTFALALLVNAAFTLAAWIVMASAAEPLVALFRAKGEAAELIRLFCQVLAPLFGFLGALFVANAVFNTLGHARLATLLNWGRATIGTIPFVLLGSHFAGASGVLVGNMFGAIPFGLLAIVIGSRLIAQIGRDFEA